MGVFQTHGTDKEAEVKGIVLDFGDYRVRVARTGGANVRFLKLFEALTKPHRRAIETEALSEEKGAEIAHEAFAKAIVLGWDTPVKQEDGTVVYEPWLEGENGEKIEYSVENCISLFKRLPDFFTTIREEAGKVANFRRNKLAIEAGN